VIVIRYHPEEISNLQAQGRQSNKEKKMKRREVRHEPSNKSAVGSSFEL
jgi:hypothetical protein